MTRNWLRILFMIASLLIGFAPVVQAQIDMQQRVSSQAQSGVTGAHSRPDAASAAIRLAPLGAAPEDFAQLRLGPGFLISLEVLDDPDFTGSYRIDQDGEISVPVLGTVHIGGQTASEARMQIKKRLLDSEILKDPQVGLTVTEYIPTEVNIIGEVMSPGKYPLLTSHKLVDVLALAGGITVLAGNEVEISHPGAGAGQETIHYSKATSPKAVEGAIVLPGDTVQVRRAGVVYVLGAVNRPGGFVMQEEGTLHVMQAISLASGTTLTAASGAFYILRRNADGSETNIEVPFKKIVHGKLPDMELHATDVLYVPNSGMKSLLINSQGILASVSSSSIYAAAVNRD